MKKIVLITCVAVLAVVMSNPVAAQQASDQTMLSYEVLTEEWSNLIAGALDLTEAEGDAFWPVYKQFRLERKALTNRRKDVIKIFVDSYSEMSPEMSRILLNQSFAIDKEIIELKMKYADLFDDVLPPNKVTRFFQTENKLETVMKTEIAKDVPLAK